MSQMETAHPRLRRKEDFVWYLIFVTTTILVSQSFFRACEKYRFFVVLGFAFCFSNLTPHIICPDSVVPTTITVPGNEED